MLETVREFSAARRAEAGEDDEAVGRFLDWARDFGVAYHDALFGSDSQAAWERIKAEQDNLVLALRHALARTDNPATAALAAVLGSLWSTGTSFPRLIALAADTGPPLSHYHPEPAYVEVARTAAVLGTATVFMGPGPRRTPARHPAAAASGPAGHIDARHRGRAERGPRDTASRLRRAAQALRR